MIDRTSPHLRRLNALKRAGDIALISLTSPVLLITAALTSGAILLTMGRPIFYKQMRIGLNERPFTLWKFRTMNSRRDELGNLLPDRMRITKAGALVRKLSLDELPQFLNVWRGDMAIVGPRPLLPEYLPFYEDHEVKRHWVRPGITGLSQVSGRNHLGWDDRLALDAYYVDNLSITQDLAILGNTVRRIINSSGVSIVAGDSGERLDVLRSYPIQQGLSLRRFEYADIPLRVRLFNDPEIRRHMSLPSHVTVESTYKWLRAAREDSNKRDFVAYSRGSQEVVALLGIRDREDRRIPEVYILVDPKHQRKGYGRIALTLLFRWMRSQPHFSGCWLTVSRDNSTALALYRKMGFVVVDNATASDDRVEMIVRWDDNK